MSVETRKKAHLDILASHLGWNRSGYTHEAVDTDMQACLTDVGAGIEAYVKNNEFLLIL